jgi:uncharacterized protein (DUF2249 family)
MATETQSPRTVDLRSLGPCVERKAHVLALFDVLASGDSFDVVNDHLPNGLRRHLDAERPGRFEWTLLEDGPELFRVRVRRIG